MSTPISDLVISMAGDLAKLRESTDGMVSIVGDMAGKIDGLAAKAAKSLAGIAAGLVSVRALNAFEENISGAIEYAASLEKIAAQAGTTASALSGLVAIGKLSGTTAEEIAGGMQKMQKSMFEVAAGGGKAQAAFKALKLDVKDASGSLKDADAFMLEFAQKLVGIDNKTQQVAYAMQAMKGSGANLIPFFRDLADQGEIVAKITDEQAAASHRYEVTLIQLAMVKKQIYGVIAQQILPVMQALAEMWLDNKKKADGFAGTIKQLAAENRIREWATNTAIAVAMVVDGFRYVTFGVETLGHAVAVMATFFIEAFQNIGNVIGTTAAMLPDVANLLQGIGMILSGQFITGAEMVKRSWEALSGGAGLMATRFKDSFSNIGNAAKGMYEDFQVGARDFVQGAAVDAVINKIAEVTARTNAGKHAAHEHAEVVKKEVIDAYDKLLDRLSKEEAKLTAEIASLQKYGIATKATTEATVRAELETDKMAKTLAERAAREKTNVDVLKDAAIAEAKRVDGLIYSKETWEAYTAAVNKHNSTMASEVQGIVEQVEKLQDQINTYGMATQAVTAYAIAKLEAKRAALLLMEGTELEVKQLDLMIAKLQQLGQMQGQVQWLHDQAAVWTQISDAASSLFIDLATNGDEAFKHLGDSAKHFMAELIGLFAKRLILQLAANLTGNGALALAANTAGNGSVAGSVLNYASSAWTAYQSGASVYTALFGGAAGASGVIGGASAGAGTALAVEGSYGVGAGVTAGAAEGVAGGLAESIGWTGWGLIIAAAVYAIMRFTGGGGGPKVEGSSVQSFDAQGNALGPYHVTGEYGNSFFGGHQLDSGLTKPVADLYTGYANILSSLGGTRSGSVGFGLGVSNDPAGDAQSFLTANVMRNGQSLMDFVGKFDDKEVGPAMALQMKRMLLTALQASDFEEAYQPIKDLLNTVSASTASAEVLDGIMQQASAMKQIIDVLATWDVPGLDVHALQAMAHEGETLTDTFNNVAQAMGNYREHFYSAAENQEANAELLAKQFTALGVTMPTTKEAFRALVDGIDKTTEEGAKLWRALIELSPAFADVADAAEAMMNSFDQLMSSIRPGYAAGRNDLQLSSSIQQFQAGNAWAAGMTQQEFLEQLKTITREDFSHYDPKWQALILNILGLDHTMHDGTAAIADAVTNLASTASGQSGPATGYTTMADALVGNVHNIIGAATGGGSQLDKFIAEKGIIDIEYAKLDARRQALEAAGANSFRSPAFAEYNAVVEAMQRLGNHYHNELIPDIEHLSDLMGQYGDHTGEAIFQLEKWYAAQQAIVGDNAAALAALASEYAGRMQDILDQAAAQADQALESLRAWRNGLLTSGLSTATPAQKLDTLAAQYQAILKAAQGGDTKAIGNLSAAAEAYLKMAQQMFGSSAFYQAIYDQILADTGGIVGTGEPTAQEAYYTAATIALPDAGGEVASDLAVKRVEAAVYQLIDLISKGVTVSTPEASEVLDRIHTEIASGGVGALKV
jgi:hypothetical protein